jgi:hypothetical protein
MSGIHNNYELAMFPYMVMVVDLDIFGDGSCALHDSDSFIVVPSPPEKNQLYKEKGTRIVHHDEPLTNFHLCPLTPDLCEIFHQLERHVRALLQDLARIFEIWLSLTVRSALLVEPCEIDVEPM